MSINKIEVAKELKRAVLSQRERGKAKIFIIDKWCY